MKIDNVNDRLARMVVRILRKREIANVRYAYLKNYSNCREQGFVLHVTLQDMKILPFTFSENRNSDHVVVYKGDWNLQPKTCWEQRSYYGTPKEAADAIEKEIKAHA